MSLRALVVLGLGILAISSGAILFRLVEAGPWAAAAWRLLFSALFLAPVALGSRRVRRELRELGPRRWRRALLSGLFLALHFGLWVPSLALTSVASSVLLVTSSPVFVALLSPWALGERVDRRTALGIVLATGGAAVIVLADASRAGHALLGDLLALGGAAAAAGYFLLGRGLRARLSLLGYVWPVYGTAGLWLTGAALLGGQAMTGYDRETWLGLVALAAAPQLMGHSAFNWALSHLSAAYVSAATLGEPIGSALLAWLILHEAPPPSTAVGGVLVIAGLALATQGEARSLRRSARAGD